MWKKQQNNCYQTTLMPLLSQSMGFQYGQMPKSLHCTPGILHSTPRAFMEHPSSPLSHSIAQRVNYTAPHQPVWPLVPPPPQHWTSSEPHGTPPAFTEHPSSTLPHSIAQRVYYTAPHQPLWNTPLPPSPTALHTGCTTQHPHSNQTAIRNTPEPCLQ